MMRLSSDDHQISAKLNGLHSRRSKRDKMTIFTKKKIRHSFLPFRGREKIWAPSCLSHQGASRDTLDGLK